jgi:hypothetical protein
MTFPTGGNEFLKSRLIAPTPSHSSGREQNYGSRRRAQKNVFLPHTLSAIFQLCVLAGNAATKRLLNDDFPYNIVFFVRSREMCCESEFHSHKEWRNVAQRFANKPCRVHLTRGGLAAIKTKAANAAQHVQLISMRLHRGRPALKSSANFSPWLRCTRSSIQTDSIDRRFIVYVATEVKGNYSRAFYFH